MAKRTKKRKALDPSLPIFQFKITLQHIEPPIWRRVLTNDGTLDELHEIIQVCMGWECEHMHAFVIEGEQYTDIDGVDPYAYHDSGSVRMSDLVEQGSLRFRYDYDFGDDWKHIVEIEKTLQPDEDIRYPRCVKGERACPPEDCGGPWGYPYFLERVQDPRHEEHDETLEWVGGEFDPEEFDLEEVNQELQQLRRWLGKRKGKHSPQATFGKGDRVQMKPGIVHSQYPDIPLGGWVGTVTRVAWLIPVGYEIRWTGETLKQVHPVYFKRCERDGMETSEYWADEGEVVASDSGQEAPAMEQPTKLALRLLSSDDPEDRIRMIFGLTSDDPLPQSSEKTQQQYMEYLEAYLLFPFKADYSAASLPGPDTGEDVTVIGFASQSPIDPDDGIVCQVEKGRDAFDVPLSQIQVDEDDPNIQYVEDYTYWLWELKEYDEEDESDEDDFEDDLIEEGSPDPAQFPIGTVAFYGPDDKTTTKIVAGVINEEDAEPIIKRWVATDVTTNPKMQREMDKFFKKHGVKRVGMSEGNMGCPHEEGEDFPVREDCPFCPFWKGKQGSGRQE